jgi:peptidoglycan/LPS O-acetylase OafA/YrhL
MAPSAKATRPYFPQLDGVRAIAALMVMVFHFCHYTGIGGPVKIGQTGVDLFFVLSGFLITTILLQAPTGDWHEIRTFYIRRTLRIFPLYYGYLIGSALFGTVCSIWFWIYLQNIPISREIPIVGPNHFWSLAIEEQFYLVWPFLVLFLPRRWLVKTLWGVVAVAFLSRIVLIPMGIGPGYFTITRLDGLAAGALLAAYFQRGVLQRYRRGILIFTAVSAIALWAEWTLFHNEGLPWVQITKFSLSTFFYAGAVGYLVISGPHPVNRFLSTAPMRFIGRISYGLYVFHPVVFDFVLVRTYSVNVVIRFVACFAAVFVVSLISWYAYESQFIRLKDKLAPERKKFPAYVTSV